MKWALIQKQKNFVHCVRLPEEGAPELLTRIKALVNAVLSEKARAKGI